MGDSERERRTRAIERAARESRLGTPLRTDWRCAPTDAPGTKTIDCTFSAIDGGPRCGAIVLFCPDGGHAASEVCTTALAEGKSQVVRVGDFSPALVTAAADCTRIRFRPYGRGYEPAAPDRHAPPTITPEEADAEVARRRRTGEGLAELRARCAPYIGVHRAPAADFPLECQSLLAGGRRPPTTPFKLPAAAIERVMQAFVVARVKQCSKEPHWRADVTVEITATGEVRGVEVHGDIAQTEIGQCVHDAVTAAKFPAMKSPSMKFPYSFAF